MDATAALIDALRAALPAVDAEALAAAIQGLVRGERATIGGNSASLTLGQGNTITNATLEIGDVVGGDKIVVTVPLPQPLDPLPAALATFVSMPLDAVPPPTTALPPVSRMILGRNPQFVGRERDLLALARAIADPHPTVMVAAVTTGLGGIGKTSLAVEFAYRYGRYFQGGVFWLNCADPAAIPGEVAACAATLGLPVLSLALDAQVAAVRRAWNDAIPRLLILDTCEDPHVLAHWTPAIGGCRVLVTARRGDWSAAARVPVGVLGRRDSIDLVQRLAPHVSVADAGALAALVGDFPLALHLAGRYLTRMKGRETPTQYLERLAAVDILDHPAFQGRALPAGELLPSQHDQHVARTFALSFERLDPADPVDAVARHLLACLAGLAPGELVPHALLWAMIPDGVEPLDGVDACERLIAVGLVEHESDAALHVHRLVHRFLGRVLAIDDVRECREDGLCSQAAALRQDSGAPAATILLPHLRWVAHAIMPARSDRRAARLLALTAAVLRAQGAYREARPLLERTLAITEARAGQGHLDTAVALNDLGTLLQAQGASAEARPLLERAIEIREAALRPDHPDLAASLDSLAGLLRDQGMYAEARVLYDWALAIREAALGPEHPDTATSLDNLAALRQAQGASAEAQALYERALAIREAALGPDHPETAISLNHVGAALQRVRRFELARPLFLRALAIHETVFGPTHPGITSLLSNLAGVHAMVGEYAAAQALLERSLAIHDAVFGPMHANTATLLLNVAWLLRAQGQDIAARAVLERSLAMSEAISGPRHPAVARSLSDLAALLTTLGEYQDARVRFDRALTIQEASLPPNHPFTARTLHGLATLLLAQGDAAAARPLLVRALAMRLETLDPDHPDIAAVRADLAGVGQDPPKGTGG